MKDVTIIIPSWNGKDILVKSLPVVLKLAPQSTIIVVDDGSIDGTVDFLKKYPSVKVIRSEINLGFTKSINSALKLVETEFVCLLNNDVYPVEGFLDNAKKILKKDNEVCAVTFNEENSSWPQVQWLDGKLSFKQGEKDGFDHYCMWPSGGSCLIRTIVMKDLGGFREIFSPGYFEDIELGFRIWRSGRKIVWAKDSKVIHRHETSFKKLNPRFVSDLKQSNELVFTWITFDNGRFLREHVNFLVKYTITHPGYLRIILLALIKYTKVTPQKYQITRSVKEVIDNANEKYR
jgi:GT2 family glycosyltransferase